MPLDVDISLINIIEGEDLPYQSLDTEDVLWSAPPPEILQPYKFHSCKCSGPSTGYEIGLKYGALICRIEVTAWGVTYRKSTPTDFKLELVQMREKPPYRLELVLM